MLSRWWTILRRFRLHFGRMSMDTGGCSRICWVAKRDFRQVHFWRRAPHRRVCPVTWGARAEPLQGKQALQLELGMREIGNRAAGWSVRSFGSGVKILAFEARVAVHIGGEIHAFRKHDVFPAHHRNDHARCGAGTLALYSGNQGTSSSLSCERGTVGISMKNVRACTINFEVTALKEGCSKSLEVLMSICIVARPATPISSRHRKRRSHVWVRCGSLRLLALALSVL